ncbi:MAG TPA: serine/threonine-protein kinase [Methylomirabilota bacterium]|nr:serine/threonine-protein kinase [Methylomirabilota bacterium]
MDDSRNQRQEGAEKSDSMRDSSNRDVEVFTEALQLPRGQRAAFLERACGNDSELREKVEALLEGHEHVGDFLEHSPQTTSLPARSGVSAGEKPGDRIGHYKLLQQIGEGGGGVVFMAEQEEPVRRRVALKIIKPGMDTKSVIARFEAERQALALMDHPNIAKIFDAGATESGRPYFVMELVRGIKITDYCDRHALTTEERLKLFVQVCQAVQHAHQKGVIHRDIKPSNILVTTTIEDAALPVVIDFGIAKATTNQRLTDKTLFTAFEMLIGTPAYMSPEQAALTSVDVDTRTDIYSLGVLLYELLTGSTPFDTQELLKSGLDEIRRVIREQEPINPSARLSKLTDADLTTVAQHRDAEPRTLIRAVHGDLDWIAMKALEKDRTRRYPTANGLALDVQRFLANETVSARPPSKLYRLRKAVLRNKLLFAAVGAIALLLVVSLIVVSVALARERQSRREADAASVKSQQITKFLEAMLNGVGPAVARGRDTAMLREILDETAERVGREMTNQPEVEADLRSLIASLYEQIGNSPQAEEMARRALAIRQKKFGAESLEAAASLNLLGLQLMVQHKLPEAERVDSEALAIRKRRLGDDHPDTATSLNDLAAVYRDQGRLKEAEAMALEALRIRRKIFQTNHLDVADSLRNLCIILGNEGRWVEAEKTGREVLAMRRNLVGLEHPWVASALEDLGWALNAVGKYEEAQSLDSEALVMRQKLLGDEHPDVPRNLNALGQLLGNRGDLPAAEAVLKAVLSIQRRLLGDDNQATLETFCSLAKVLQREGKQPEAESVLREALEVWGRRGETGKPERLYALRGLAETLEEEGKWPEAEALWRESLALWRKRGGNEERQSMYTLRKLGLALEAERKWTEAESVHREALAISRKSGEEDPEALVDLERLVRVLVAEKQLVEAQQLLDKMLTPAFVTQASSANLLVQRVNVMGRRGRWQEAAADAARILELQPNEHYHYHRLAGLLVITHDRRAYQQVCKKIVTQFADTTNPFVAERVAQDCLLLSDSGADLALMDKLANTSITAGSGDAAMPYFQACKAMSNYRLGRFSEAIDWGQKAAKSSMDFAQAKAYAVLAMAHWQLGEKDEARAALGRGEVLAGNSTESGAEDLGESWVAWLMARISLDEAAEAIGNRSLVNQNANQP